MKKLNRKNLLFGVLNIAVESALYALSSLILTMGDVGYHNVKISLDDLIPFNKIWIIPYVVSYAWWIIAGILISTNEEKKKKDYFVTMVISVVIGFIIFLCFPTNMDRNAEGIFEQLNGNDLISKLCLFIIKNDGDQIGVNLFPSFHCLVSALCVIGTIEMNNVSKSYKIFTIIMAILVCMSTVLIKQHYIMDVVSGILIPCVVYVIVKRINIK